MTDETRQEIARQLARELASRTVISPIRPGQGFQSFGEFKRTIGVAGSGLAWHHIVGQTTSNLQRFGSSNTQYKQSRPAGTRYGVNSSGNYQFLQLPPT